MFFSKDLIRGQIHALRKIWLAFDYTTQNTYQKSWKIPMSRPQKTTTQQSLFQPKENRGYPFCTSCDTWNQSQCGHTRRWDGGGGRSGEGVFSGVLAWLPKLSASRLIDKTSAAERLSMLVSMISGLGVRVEHSLQRELVAPVGEAFIVFVLGQVGSCWLRHMNAGPNGRFSVMQTLFVVWEPLVMVTVLLYCEGGRVMEMTSLSSSTKKKWAQK